MSASLVLLKNFISSMIVKLAAPLSAFVIFTMIARRMGVEVVGQYTLLATLFMIFQFVSSLGLSPMVVRDIANQRQTPVTIYSHVAVICLAGLLVWIPLLLGIAWWGNYPHDLLIAIMVLSAFLPFACSCMINEAVLMGMERFEFIPAINIAEAVYLLAGSLTVMACGLDIIGLAAVLASGKLLSSAMGLWFIKKETPLYLQPIDQTLVRNIIKILPPFFLNFAFGILYYRIDILQLSFLVPQRDMGLYSAASKLYLLAAILPDSFSTALSPLIARAAADGDVMGTSFRAIRYTLIGLTPILLTLYVFGEKILVLFFGQAYLGSAPTLKIMLWLLLPYASNAILGNLFLACDRQKITAGLTALSVMLAVALNFFLIRRVGFPGAALSMVIVQMSCLLMLLFYMKERMGKVKALTGHIALFVPAIAGGVAASFWPWGGDWGRFFVSILVALSLVATLKIAGRADLDWLQKQLASGSRKGLST